MLDWSQSVNSSQSVAAVVVCPQDAVFNVNPGAASGSIFLGLRSELNYLGTGGFSGAGHGVAAIGHTIMNAAGQNGGFLYGVEGKIDCLAGTIASAIPVESQIASVLPGAVITSATLGNFQVVGNAGTIASLTGVGISASNSGVIGTFTGVAVLGPTGSVTTSIGFFIDDLTGSFLAAAIRAAVSSGVGKYNLFLDGTAPNYLRGDLRVGASVNEVTGAALVVNGAFAIADNFGEPDAIPGFILVYGDQASGDLRCVFGDGFRRTLGADS